MINPTHNNILSLYFVSIATNVAPLDLQMSTRQLLYFLETLFRVDGEVYCYSRSFLLLIYMYKVHHCPISWKFHSGWGRGEVERMSGLGWGVVTVGSERGHNGVRLGCKPFQKKFWKLGFCAHLIQFFLLIPNMVTKNHRMHLNPLYDRKTGLSQPTQFGKKF